MFVINRSRLVKSTVSIRRVVTVVAGTIKSDTGDSCGIFELLRSPSLCKTCSTDSGSTQHFSRPERDLPEVSGIAGMGRIPEVLVLKRRRVGWVGEC